MITEAKEYLLKNWESLGLGAKPQDIIFIKFADRRIRAPEVGVISFLLKGKYGKEERPLLILRTPRYPQSAEANETLQLEYDNLNSIHQKIETAEVPRVVVWTEIDGARILAINFLSGEPISSRILSSNILKSYVENFGLAFSWLVNFQKTLGQSAAGNYPQHGDFHAENIFIRDGKITGIIDWEDYSFDHPAGFDLVHYIKTYFEALFQYFGQRQDLRALDQLSSSEETLLIVKASVKNYLDNIGLSETAVPTMVKEYLARSRELAASPRKRAESALKKLELYINMAPKSIEDLLLFLTIPPLGGMLKAAKKDGRKELTASCEKRLTEIVARAEKNKSLLP